MINAAERSLGAGMAAHRFEPRKWRRTNLSCDHCRGELGRDAECYWHMRFCSTVCVSEYQQRLSTETQLKILTLDDRTSCLGVAR